MADLADQPVPSDTRCPECGGEPAHDTVKHRLQALGYLHDDLRLTCSDCGERWTCGVPIGEFDKPELAADFECPCGETRLVHWIDATGRNARGDIALGVKCPNEDCRHFEWIGRETDANNVAMTGYEHLGGQTAGADAYGYPEVDDATDQ
ncbi:hypothetical protein [Halomarina rubra]|uniref:Uncharacterized protein n=1 Tax=Halomarina rubra TaxID=2071873 RepID=A0ABD6B1C9_9EURY|nr:hypothetical protein [Halomarina rubra]